MNFRKKLQKDHPELNFIPLIDVLLVIIIFLVVSTTFSKFSELKINLPVAEANPVESKNLPINISITEDGEFRLQFYSQNDNTYLGEQIVDSGVSLIYRKDYERFLDMFKPKEQTADSTSTPE